MPAAAPPRARVTGPARARAATPAPPKPSAPTTAPRTPPIRPLLLPPPPPAKRQADAAAEGAPLRAVGGYFGDRVGWVLGAALTVVGSFYLAGSAWSGLTAGWRQAVILGFLAVYAPAFSALGHRLGRLPRTESARRWLLWVAAGLAPVHAMSAGALFQVSAAAALPALAAVAGLHAWILAGALPHLLQDTRRVKPVGAAYLMLSMGVGLIPLAGGAGWLALPGSSPLAPFPSIATPGRAALAAAPSNSALGAGAAASQIASHLQ